MAPFSITTLTWRFVFPSRGTLMLTDISFSLTAMDEVTKGSS
jgi:hypothetical protein